MDIKAELEKLKGMGLKQAHDLLTATLLEARNIADAADQAKRDFTADERVKVADLLGGAKTIKARVTELKGDADMRAQINSLGDGVAVDADPAKRKRQSLGTLFTTAKQWQDWLKGQQGAGGFIPDSAKGLRSPAIAVPDYGIVGDGAKTLITGVADGGAGAFVESDRTGIYEPLGRYPLNLRQLVQVRQTGSDVVEFVRQVTASNAAATVAEATATAGTSGIKPESGMTFERVTENVKTIAVWVPATKRALSDAAQLRGLIDQELRDDLGEELENQMLNGGGTGEDFTGLASTDDTLAQPFNTDIITTTRKAITNLLINGKQVPSAWLFNPQDWETIELLKDGEDRYYWGGPINRGPATLWGVPVAQSFFQPQGSAWLGNWSKAVLWDREQANISVSDSHDNFFIRNMVAILAEMRAAFGVIRPTAFVEVDLEAGS